MVKLGWIFRVVTAKLNKTLIDTCRVRRTGHVVRSFNELDASLNDALYSGVVVFFSVMFYCCF